MDKHHPSESEAHAVNLDWEAELKALLKVKGYEMSEPAEAIGIPPRRIRNDAQPPHTTEEVE